jgi:hypothetical protein
MYRAWHATGVSESANEVHARRQDARAQRIPVRPDP